MQQRTFEEVRESLRGKVILVANRGIPARRISRSIRERFEAIAAITATDIDKTEPAAASAQELILLGADPHAAWHAASAFRWSRVPTNPSTFRARERSFMKLVSRSCSKPRAAAADAAFSS